MLLGMALIFTTIFVAPVTLKAYDAAHPLVVSCRITQATAGDGSSRSTRGIGASFNQVRLDSSNCGVVSMRKVKMRRRSPRNFGKDVITS
ncbi:hypothetical protein [Curtobacterium sp. MCSS17_007]|uniref:hypothetical protein n=1 Tax=Curtobacterium sp. MCSS17_007 TaxID=2175646 RepID=UPI0011B36EA0|nr:hypothetical protein [Curtobacterium sp. MCSS17_007]WIE75334.1 hypothetical protein DEJ22_013950 [Curtobacterium sp. MCSS17_007]